MRASVTSWREREALIATYLRGCQCYAPTVCGEMGGKIGTPTNFG